MGGKSPGRRLRQGLIVCYSLLLTAASIAFCAMVFLRSQTVVLEDWATVMQRRAADIPAVVEILDSRWGSAELTQSQVMFQLDSLVRRVPRYYGSLQKGADSDYRMLGKITYISGKNVSFALGEVLWLDDTPYYGQAAADEVASILRLMRKQVYTIQNLAGLMQSAGQMVLFRAGEDTPIPIADRTAFIQSIQAASAMEQMRDVQYALEGGEAPSYRIQLQLGEVPGDAVVLLVYANEYIQVLDMTSARGVLMHLTGDLYRYCRDAVQGR